MASDKVVNTAVELDSSGCTPSQEVVEKLGWMEVGKELGRHLNLKKSESDPGLLD